MELNAEEMRLEMALFQSEVQLKEAMEQLHDLQHLWLFCLQWILHAFTRVAPITSMLPLLTTATILLSLPLKRLKFNPLPPTQPSNFSLFAHPSPSNPHQNSIFPPTNHPNPLANHPHARNFELFPQDNHDIIDLRDSQFPYNFYDPNDDDHVLFSCLDNWAQAYRLLHSHIPHVLALSSIITAMQTSLDRLTAAAANITPNFSEIDNQRDGDDLAAQSKETWPVLVIKVNTRFRANVAHDFGNTPRRVHLASSYKKLRSQRCHRSITTPPFNHTRGLPFATESPNVWTNPDVTAADHDARFRRNLHFQAAQPNAQEIRNFGDIGAMQFRDPAMSHYLQQHPNSGNHAMHFRDPSATMPMMSGRARQDPRIGNLEFRMQNLQLSTQLPNYTQRNEIYSTLQNLMQGVPDYTQQFNIRNQLNSTKMPNSMQVNINSTTPALNDAAKIANSNDLQLQDPNFSANRADSQLQSPNFGDDNAVRSNKLTDINADDPILRMLGDVMLEMERCAAYTERCKASIERAVHLSFDHPRWSSSGIHPFPAISRLESCLNGLDDSFDLSLHMIKRLAQLLLPPTYPRV